MSDTPLANDPAARTETGEIKNVSETTTPSTTETAAVPETKPATPTLEVKVEAGASETDKDKSLLNKTEADKAKPEGAPEKYEEFKVPEGYVLDPKIAEEASGIFKGMNLSQTQAQSLVDFYAAKTREAANAPFEAYTAMRQEWQTKVAADPEIGSKLPEVKQTVSRALDSLGDPKLASDFREAMDLTGAGDHPAFIKAFYKLAQQVVEGHSVRGSNPSPAGQKPPGAGPISAAKALYPNNP